MAAAIPEAVGVASSAGGAAAGTGEAAAGSARAGGGARGARALPATPQRQREGTPPRGGSRRERQFRQSAKRKGRGALRARLPGSHSYQPVILAEFVVAVVVVATGPIAKGGTPEAQTKGSPSPYSVNTLKQLVAIGGVYFVLAILASSRRAGRYAAWFGGLVLVVLGLAELASGDLSAFFHVFAPGSGATFTPIQGQSAAAAAGQAVTGPGAVQDNQQVAQAAAQAVTGPGAVTQSVTFSQPGVATTTETSPGVAVT
jgi:hypothetical protein